MKQPLNLPDFKTADEELEFWSNINLADYYESSDAKPVTFPRLKPSVQTISLRLPTWLLNRIREEAQYKDVPYQSYIKTKLADLFS